MKIIDAALKRNRVVLLTLVLLLVAGAVTYAGIPKESDPDVPIPYIYVSMTHEGISPEDAERLLARPVEQALRSIEGVKEMTSTSSQGHASVTLEFEAGFDNEQALTDVRREVDEIKAKLPDDTDEPSVNEINVALFPVLSITLSGPVQERALLRMARLLRDDLEGVPGVLEVDIKGDREELVEITVDPALMDTYGISQDELFSLFQRNNRLIAAGVMDTGHGRFAVKVPGVLETVQDVQNLPVKVSGDRVVRFSDIAQITRNFKDPSSFARLNGERAITLDVKKRIGENVIQTIAYVRHVVSLHQQRWPEAVHVNFSQDKSEDIKQMLSDLENSVLTAVLLVVIVIIGVLGARSALLVAVAIPGAFLCAILVIGGMGLTINIVVLFSLIMAVGMLVDGAIVVTEFADRKMCEGDTPKDAFAEASRRMAWPIIASTATTLAAFCPLLFWPGIMGQFMKYLPITLIAVLSASLLMALVYVPALGGVFGRPGAMSDKARRQIAAAEGGDLNEISGFARRYLNVLTWVVDHPRGSFAIAMAVVVAIFIGYGVFGAGVRFFPEVEPDNARVTIRARGDLSIYQKDQLVREVERRVLTVDGFKSVSARTGSGGRQSSADTVGILQLELDDWQSRPPADQLMAEVRQKTDDIPGVIIEAIKERNGPNQGKPVSVEIAGVVPESLADSNKRLSRGIEHLLAGMQAVGGFVDVEDTRPLPGIEWQLVVDRAVAARYGADITLIGNAIQMVTNGIKLGEYRPEDADDEIDIRARFPSDSRSLERLTEISIQTSVGLVPIANFVDRVPAPRVTQIDRSSTRRIMKVEANVETGLLVDTQVKKLQEWLDANPLPVDGLKVNFKGEDQDQRESQSFLTNAFMVALFVMLIILVAQFNSFYQAGLILSAVILSTAAVFLGLMLMQRPFGIVMGGIGVISLAGVVVNNNIILIDTYNVLRAQGMSAREALLRTGAARLRPVLLTAGTTILGLLPMAFGVNVDIIGRDVTMGAPSSQWWIDLSSAVAGGLAFATPITLLLTPALLMWRAGRQQRAEKDAQALQINAETGA